MIRNATASDFAPIQNLLKQLETEQLDPILLHNIFLEKLEDPKYKIFIFEKDKKILAFISLRIETQLHHAAMIAEIMEFVVNEKDRSKGIGKRLFRHALQFAKKNNSLQIEVACNQKRKATHHFYTQQKMKNSHYKFSYPL